jgi:hypothetical protein
VGEKFTTTTEHAAMAGSGRRRASRTSGGHVLSTGDPEDAADG